MQWMSNEQTTIMIKCPFKKSLIENRLSKILLFEGFFFLAQLESKCNFHFDLHVTSSI